MASSVVPATMRCVVVAKAGGELEYVQRPVPQPKRNEVLLKVEACGVCHSDALLKAGGFPTYPRIPGHEVVGTIVKVGEEVKRYKVGDRVGRGWHGGHCFGCDACFRGDFIMCQHEVISGITSDGGYAEYMAAPWESLAFVPDGLSAVAAGPLLCAGVTCFNSLRNMKVAAGSVVAVQGIGGLGHLGIQFAHKMGFYVVALSSGTAKKELAHKLGADVYVDGSKEDAVVVLHKLGGAKIILYTAPSTKEAAKLAGALAVDGKLLVVGAGHEPIELSTLSLIMSRTSVQGWPSGHASDSQDALQFAARAAIAPMTEVFPLSKAAAAFDKMMKNEVRFRAVLVPDALMAAK